MGRDQQIEKMAKVIFSARDSGDIPYEVIKSLASDFYRAGYREATDLAEEIFADIEKIIDKHYNKHIFGNNDLEDEEHEAIMDFSCDVTYDIDKLKEKYTKGEN